MTELLTAAQMRAIEEAAISSGEVTGLELMERAGRGVVAAIFEEWPELAGAERGASPSRSPGYLEQEEARRAVVLCGPGNNGGDGFVVARLLRELGWAVEVFLYGDPARLPADARVNYERWRGMGEVNGWDDLAIRRRFEDDETGEQLLIVDALFGTGLTRAMPDDTSEMWRGFMPSALGMNAHSTGMDRFVAVDFPSGICSDSGKDFGALPTHLTVTFHRAKVGHFMWDGCLNYGGAIGCHKVVVKDIGLDKRRVQRSVTLLDRPTVAISKVGGAHKFTHGHALILSGPAGRTGAARLTARGALRIGAGLVTLGVPGAAQLEVAAQVTAVMLRHIEDGAGLAEVLGDARITALCLGPGLGVERAAELVAAAVRAEHAPYVVLDADALTAIAAHAELFGALHDRCVLTPHGGEFARLFPDIAEKLATPAERGPAYSKVDATRAAAARCGAVVLFKGPDTVIAHPDGRCSVNAAVYDRVAPWLATAGAGDVLAGFITGLLARGFAPMQAAETGAWLHVECARRFGPGLIAEDLPEQLPGVFRDLGL